MVEGRALVTGGGVRIGAAIVRALAAAGHDVVIHYARSRAPAEALAAEIASSGRRSAVVGADLADEAAAAGLLAQAEAALGPIDILVNNAAVFLQDRLATLDEAGWSQHQAINLRAPLILAAAFVEALPAEAEGCIVNMIDQRVLNPTPNFLSYSVSKAGLWMATQVLARDLAPRVRVNAVAPGHVLPAPGMRRERFDALIARTPLKRPSTPEEIAAAVRFILETPSMTGQMVVVDSGQAMGWKTEG